MLGRRLLIFVAVLMGLAALAAAVAPRDATVSPAPAGPGTPPEIEGRAGTAPAGEAPVRRMDADGSGQAVEVALGERVRLEVTASEPATVQIGEDGLLQAADPSAPARFSLRYEEAGQVPVRVLGPDPGQARIIGVVRIR